MARIFLFCSLLLATAQSTVSSQSLPRLRSRAPEATSRVLKGSLVSKVGGSNDVSSICQNEDAFFRTCNVGKIPKERTGANGSKSGSGSKKGSKSGSGSKKGSKGGSGSRKGSTGGSGSKKGSKSGSGSKKGSKSGSGSKKGSKSGSKSGGGSKKGSTSGSGSKKGGKTGSGSKKGSKGKRNDGATGTIPPDVSEGFNREVGDLTINLFGVRLDDELSDCNCRLDAEAAILEYLAGNFNNDDVNFQCAVIFSFADRGISGDRVSSLLTTVTFELDDEFEEDVEADSACTAENLILCCVQDKINGEVRDFCNARGCDLNLCPNVRRRSARRFLAKKGGRHDNRLSQTLRRLDDDDSDEDGGCSLSSTLNEFLACKISVCGDVDGDDDFESVERAEVVLGAMDTSLLTRCLLERDDLLASGFDEDGCASFFDSCAAFMDIGIREVCEPPTASPTTVMPTQVPTAGPTAVSTEAPTEVPVEGPTDVPMEPPTEGPTAGPTAGPTEEPSTGPTEVPSGMPTASPTFGPTAIPTSTFVDPTHVPTFEPTVTETSLMTSMPTATPTLRPSLSPSGRPTRAPAALPVTSDPTAGPTTAPSSGPTSSPSSAPTANPSSRPINVETIAPVGVTVQPTVVDPLAPPSVDPTVSPTFDQTVDVSMSMSLNLTFSLLPSPPPLP